MWLAAGSAVAAMVGVSWWVVIANGGQPPGGDMIGHAAAAEWLRTLPWWDWRGWSDWFYGGQAIGVNYPPLGHAWMRFTHPVHGQMAAVALGLLVLLPWGALRLSRAVGCTPGAQRAAVAGVLVLTAASGQMHWMLSGFHATSTFFGSWPSMLATVLGLHSSAWAARGRSPMAAGIVLGLAALFNATVIPGVVVVSAALLATSGTSFGRAVRWTATTGFASLAVSAWWLVPFMAGSDRLVRWEISLSDSWGYGGLWQAATLATVGIAAAWAARCGPTSSRRLAVAALAGLSATLLGDLFSYLRPERWMELPLLVAAMAAAGLVATRKATTIQPVRPTWIVLGAAFLIVFAVVTLRLEVLPLAVWLLWQPHRSWAWGGALAWSAILLLVPLWGQVRHPTPSEPLPVTPLVAAASSAGPSDEGLVDTDSLYQSTTGDAQQCRWGSPWTTTAETGGRIRPLFGLYRETSASAEFLMAELDVRFGSFSEPDGSRPHWFQAWDASGRPSLDTAVRAEAMGARWFATCDSNGSATTIGLPGVLGTGVSLDASSDEDSWHRSAVEWWVSIRADGNPPSFALTPQAKTVPVLWPSQAGSYPIHKAAEGVTLQTASDSLTVRADEAGWAWLRVPWDPDWRSLNDTPVLKGGPGHLVVWAQQGTTELRWGVPGAVDTAAAAATGVALIATWTLATINRRRGWECDQGRPRPAANALSAFAATVDSWANTTTQTVRQAAHACRHAQSKRSS